MRIRTFFILAVVLVAGVLLSLRYMGESAFNVVPEPIPPKGENVETGLSKAIDAWLSANAADADSFFYPLADAHGALLSRFLLAEQAEQSIDAQYYLFHDDEAGRALLGNLIDAAERGVQVRLLLDDMDTQGRDDVFSRLSAENHNLEIRIFNPNWLRSARILDYAARFPRSSRRMHNKSFSVDGITSIVGGRNIGNEYFDVESEVAFSDFDIMAAGQVATKVIKEFDTYWYSGIAVEASELGDPASDERYAQWRAALDMAQAGFKEEIAAGKTAVANFLSADKRNGDQWLAFPASNDVIYDKPEKVLSPLFDTSGNLAPTIIDLMSSSENELLISSPYFIPGESGMKLFRELRERGVKITLLTNSFAANDVVVVHAGYIDYRERLIDLGVEMYEFKPGEGSSDQLALLGAKKSSLHAKTFVIDQSRVFVGSFNLDPRSAIHNTEMGIVFKSDYFGQKVNDSINERLKKTAYRVRKNTAGKLEWVDYSANGQTIIYDTEPGTDWFARASVYLMSWLPVEWLM